jgi:broad specificity phosphatase PhoE
VTAAELWVVRHALSEGNLADDRAHALDAERLELDLRDPDVPLSADGRKQAAALGRSWRRLTGPPPRVVSSPYERALATARIAVTEAGWSVDVERDERWRERDLGMIDGFTRRGIEAQLPAEAARRRLLGKFYYRPPGGESWADVAGRVRLALADYVPEEGRVVVVTHQAVLMLVRYVIDRLDEREVLALDRDHSVPNTGVCRYVLEDRLLRLRAWGDITHLQQDEAAPTTEETDAAETA